MKDIHPVSVHSDFLEWYMELSNAWKTTNGQKYIAIQKISQLGYKHNLENGKGLDVSKKYPGLSLEIQSNKEKYIRLILDNNWTIDEYNKSEFDRLEPNDNKNFKKIDFLEVEKDFLGQVIDMYTQLGYAVDVNAIESIEYPLKPTFVYDVNVYKLETED